MTTDEIEVENEAPSLAAFIDDVSSKNFTGAQTAFDHLLGGKLQDALDAEKVRMAQSVYNGEEEQLELDLEPEEVEVEDSEIEEPVEETAEEV